MNTLGPRRLPAPLPTLESLDDAELVGDLLLHSAAVRPDAVALVDNDGTMTYTELTLAACRIARLLADRLVEPGARVGLICNNCIDFVVAYFGISFAGGVVVPINPLLKAGEVAHILNDGGIGVLFSIPDREDVQSATAARWAVDETGGTTTIITVGGEEWSKAITSGDTLRPVRVNAEDPAVIIYTSGTTGRPRGAELRHRNVRDNAIVGGRVFGWDPSSPDVVLCALPLFHSFGQSAMQNTCIAYGGKLVLVDRFDATHVLDLMDRWKVTYFGGVPTMFWRLINVAPRDSQGLRLRVALSGGAALPIQLHRDFQREFGITISEGYGLSETSPLACTSRPGEPVREGSIGRPIPGVEMRLIDDSWNEVEHGGIGEIAIRGHNVMRGYHGQPESTALVLKDGWLRTGDLARRDSDGFYYIVDRAKDMVIRAGYNVYPREVEEIIMTHPDVSLVAVIGVPDNEHGEEVKAVVVPRAGRTLDPEELRSWARDHMAAYKYPRIVEIRDSLPLGPTGKILKRAL